MLISDDNVVANELKEKLKSLVATTNVVAKIFFKKKKPLLHSKYMILFIFKFDAESQCMVRESGSWSNGQIFIILFDSFIIYGLDQNKWIQSNGASGPSHVCAIVMQSLSSPLPSSLVFDSLSIFYRNNNHH
jgi:hypothetical protein